MAGRWAKSQASRSSGITLVVRLHRFACDVVRKGILCSIIARPEEPALDGLVSAHGQPGHLNITATARVYNPTQVTMLLDDDFVMQVRPLAVGKLVAGSLDDVGMQRVVEMFVWFNTV